MDWKSTTQRPPNLRTTHLAAVIAACEVCGMRATWVLAPQHHRLTVRFSLWIFQ
jgi:hypothetical protein